MVGQCLVMQVYILNKTMVKSYVSLCCKKPSSTLVSWLLIKRCNTIQQQLKYTFVLKPILSQYQIILITETFTWFLNWKTSLKLHRNLSCLKNYICWQGMLWETMKINASCNMRYGSMPKNGSLQETCK